MYACVCVNAQEDWKNNQIVAIVHLWRGEYGIQGQGGGSGDSHIFLE